MPGASGLIKPTHKAIKAYYEVLRRYADQDVSYETALRTAFENLLAGAAKQRGWTLAPATLSLRDPNNVVRFGVMDCSESIHPRQISSNDQFLHCRVVCIGHWD